MKMILPASVNLSRLMISMIVGLWLLLCTNPQVYFYILFAPHKIVLYMDILDVDEDIFYYYKTTDQGKDHEFVFQEEVKRDGVKKGKSFLKAKALQLIFETTTAIVSLRISDSYIISSHESLILLNSEPKPVFHPPKV